jgi:hypothetical protein
MDEFNSEFFGKEFQDFYTGYNLCRYGNFFTKPLTEPPKTDFAKSFSRDFIDLMDQSKEKVPKAEFTDQESFKKPQKKIKSSEKSLEPKFSLKRDAPNRIFPESKKPKLDLLSSPQSNTKPNIFSSAKKAPIKSTPYKPTKISATDDLPLHPKTYDEEKKQIEDLKRSIEALEDLKHEQTYSNVNELIQIKQELPKLTLELLKARSRQVELLNRVLKLEIPEIKEKSRILYSLENSM